jgi:hypothetical protein
MLAGGRLVLGVLPSYNGLARDPVVLKLVNPDCEGALP